MDVENCTCPLCTSPPYTATTTVTYPLGGSCTEWPPLPTCEEDPRETVLKEALRCVTADRNLDYGPPEDNFDHIAQLWNVYDGIKGDRPDKNWDVANKMILMKVARSLTSPTKRDHWVDEAGYAACGYRCATASGTERIQQPEKANGGSKPRPETT